MIGTDDDDPTVAIDLADGMPGGSAGTTLTLSHTFQSIDVGTIDTGGEPAAEVMRARLQRVSPEAYARGMILRGYTPL
eukprot:5441482-Prymnesium_polylepis.1